MKNKCTKIGHSVNLPEVVVRMTGHLLGENVYLQVNLGGFFEQIVFIFKKRKNAHMSQLHSKDPGSDLVLFLSKRDLHCICLRDFEAL